MDKKSFYNIFSGFFMKIIILFISLFVRNFLIKYVGNEANGIISLFSSIIGVLCITELGVGAAITYSMYKPIAEKNISKITALYNFYKVIYRRIAIIIFALAAAFIPFLNFFLKDFSLDYNIYLLFFIQLFGVIVVYFFSADISLINAYKRNYITILVLSFIQIIKIVIQALVLILTANLYLYLLATVVSEIIHMIIIKIYSKKSFADVVLGSFNEIDVDTKKQIIKDIKSIFLHKVGGILVNTIDSIVISTVLGVAILGYYSNYLLLINSLITICTMVFTQMISTIGQKFVEENKSVMKNFFMKYYLVNYMLASIMFFCFYTAADSFIDFAFGDGLNLERNIVLVISINYFIQFMRRTVLTFKDSAGLFYPDRYKPIIEGVVNLILSLIFVQIFGVIGVILSTIITNLFICHLVEPFVLFKYGFENTPKKYYLCNFSFICIFILVVTLYHYNFNFIIDNKFLEFIVNGFIGVGLSIPSFLISFIIYKFFLSKNNAMIS